MVLLILVVISLISEYMLDYFMALLVLAVADLMTSGLLCTLNDRCYTVFLFHSFTEQLESVTGGTWVNVMGTKAVDRVNVPLEPPVSHKNTHRQFHNLKIP